MADVISATVESGNARGAPDQAPVGALIETDIPARLDRLPWGRFHTLVIIALGITWVLDGLEVTLAGTLIGALMESPTLRFTATDIGYATSAYLMRRGVGRRRVWLADGSARAQETLLHHAGDLSRGHHRHGPLLERLELLLLSASFTGAGIGGEYTAVNSTIQELIPARARGCGQSRHQRDILARRGFGLARLARAAQRLASLTRSSAGGVAFFIGGAIGLVILFLRTMDSGEPALAAHPWTA